MWQGMFGILKLQLWKNLRRSGLGGPALSRVPVVMVVVRVRKDDRVWSCGDVMPGAEGKSGRASPKVARWVLMAPARVVLTLPSAPLGCAKRQAG